MSVSKSKLQPDRAVVDTSPQVIDLRNAIKSAAPPHQRFSPPLAVAKFPHTGRGMMATRHISPGDVIIAVPVAVMITPAEVLRSKCGRALLSIGMNIVEELGPTLSLAFYLMHEHSCSDPSFPEYLATLPKDYSIPSQWTEADLSMLTGQVYEKAMSSRKTCEIDCHRMVSLWSTHSTLLTAAASSVRGASLPIGVSLVQLACWSWCAVNTRCVSLMILADKHQRSPSRTVRFEESVCEQESVFEQLGILRNQIGATPAALVPMLDMLNHHPECSVSTGFNPITRCFEIITHDAYEPGEEVFIKYGDYSSEDLCVEYGFIPLLPTAHDAVNVGPTLQNWFSLPRGQKAKDNLSWRLKLAERELSSLESGYEIGIEGPSWNFLAMLRLLCLPTDELRKLESQHGAICCLIGEELEPQQLEMKVWKLVIVLRDQILESQYQNFDVYRSTPSDTYNMSLAKMLYSRRRNMLLQISTAPFLQD